MDQRTKMLSTTMVKLLNRGAEENIRRILGRTHDADVASVLEVMDTGARISIFQMIPDKQRQSNILSHMGKSFQAEIAHVFEIHDLQQLIGNMDSDDAADLLGHLPDELSQRVLSGLRKDELQEVEELMSYPEDSAGGLMSSEFLTIHETLNVEDSIKKIQAIDEDLISFYIYVVNDASQLVGVLSLKQLLLSRPQEILKDVMSTDVITVDIATDQNEVARIVEKYDFLSLPVINKKRELVGVITVDDVIDVIREEAAEDIQAMGMGGADLDESYWTHIKSRIPWLLIAFIGGAFCYFSMWTTLKPFKIDYKLQNALCLLPLSFFLVSTLSSQTVTMLVGFLRIHITSTEKSWLDLKKEITVGLSLMTLLSLLFVGFSYAIRSFIPVPISLSVVLAVQLLMTLFLAISLPLFIHRLNFNPIVSAPSLSAILSNIFSVTILIFYYAVW